MNDMNEVWQGGPEDARLYQGGAQNPNTWPDGIDVIVNMQFENPRMNVPAVAGRMYLNVPIGDNEMFSEYPDIINQTAKFVHAALNSGKNVLVHCGAGWNRSGVVVAYTLVDLGYDPDEAIRMVRRARGFNALSNPHFVAWLKRKREALVESAN